MASGLKKYVISLGLLAGLRLYILSKFGLTDFQAAAPGLSKVWIRPRTSDRNMFSDVLLDREYELPLEPPPKFIIDAGANVGYTSAFFATRYPAAQIVAIEPEESNFAQLQKNLLGLNRVTALKKGLWPRVAYLHIDNPDDVKSGFRLAESDMALPGSIEATTIPALMQQFGAEQIDICKIDIEGGECELLSDPDCDAWLSRTRMLIIELHDRFRPDSSAIVDRALARHPHTREHRGDNLIFRMLPQPNR